MSADRNRRSNVSPHMSRRGVLAGAGAIVLSSLSPGQRGQAAELGRIVLTDTGGSSEQANVAAFYKPFEHDTGISIAFSPRPTMAMGQLKAMVLTGNVDWDLTYLTDYLTEIAVQQGLLDEIDYSQMNSVWLAGMLPDTATKYTTGGVVFSNVLGYSTTKWQVQDAPQSWADFWDVRRFPGRRSLTGIGYGPLEQALLADGVGPDKLYPIDVNRALAKLDEIRKDITIWTSSSAQQYQLIVNREVDLIQGYNSRIQAGINDGAPFAIQWNQAGMSADGWVIPKGAKNRTNVLKFLESTMSPARQAAATSITGNGPTSRAAIALMPIDRANLLPTHPDHLAKAFRTDAKWLAENQSELETKWTQWRVRL